MSEQKLDLILGEIGKINNEVSKINNEVGKINVELGNITKRLDSHEDLITQLIGVVKSTNEKVTIVQEDIAYLKADVSELKDGQSRQDRILETLALHSLEQVTIIRELKRIK